MSLWLGPIRLWDLDSPLAAFYITASSVVWIKFADGLPGGLPSDPPAAPPAANAGSSSGAAVAAAAAGIGSASGPPLSTAAAQTSPQWTPADLTFLKHLIPSKVSATNQEAVARAILDVYGSYAAVATSFTTDAQSSNRRTARDNLFQLVESRLGLNHPAIKAGKGSARNWFFGATAIDDMANLFLWVSCCR